VYDVIAKSLVFGVRNLDKVTDVTRHDEGRIFATAGQFAKAAKSISALDNSIGNASTAAINGITEISKKSRVLDTTLKGVNWASKNVNPLLIGAAAYRVAVADKKLEAANKELFGMSLMFGVEHYMNKIFKSNAWLNLTNKITNKKLQTIIKIFEGLIFVGGSIAASTAGYKIGDFVNSQVKKNEVKEIKVNPVEESLTTKDNYESEYFLAGQNKELIA